MSITFSMLDFMKIPHKFNSILKCINTLEVKFILRLYVYVKIQKLFTQYFQPFFIIPTEVLNDLFQIEFLRYLLGSPITLWWSDIYTLAPFSCKQYLWWDNVQYCCKVEVPSPASLWPLSVQGKDAPSWWRKCEPLSSAESSGI